MDGYQASTYGDRFADVYDDWYPHAGDVDAAVAALASLAAECGGGAVLELGVGTGRLAVPLAATGLAVTGLDASPAMLAALAAKPGGRLVDVVEGDMAGPLPAGPWAVVFVARNTLFNLADEGSQARCLAAAASALSPTGFLVVEAFVPEASPQRSSVEVREVDADRVLLFVDRHHPETQQAWSSFVELTPTGNTFRPCHIRYSTPGQIDAMASAAGLLLDRRWESWDGSPFGPQSQTHVSVYRRA